MRAVKKPLPIKLISGIIVSPKVALTRIKSPLLEKFGEIDGQSAKIPFDFTKYYEPEMGKNLTRLWVSFKGLVQPEELVKIKLTTNEIEKEFSREGKRQVNLDPGYITGARLVLATTKDYAHRIYLGNGIFGEVTLIYKNGKFQPLPWTYPDYCQSDAIEFFERVRQKYLQQIWSLKKE